MQNRNERHEQYDVQADEQPGDEGATLLFQRSLPGHERCTICPFRPVGTDRAAGTYPPRPVLPFAATPAGPPSRGNNPTLVAPANAPPATLPRPALLTPDPRGSGTLVLPDALRASGPDAATIEQPRAPHTSHTLIPLTSRTGKPGVTGITSITGRPGLPDLPRMPGLPGVPGIRMPGRAARDPEFDELASPDITVLQPALPPVIHPRNPPRARRTARTTSTRAYIALNVALGLLILTGLVLLVIRDVPSTAPGASASE
jgi:hypothetical protein